MLSRTAVQALRRGTAASASTSRTTTALALGIPRTRLYSTKIATPPQQTSVAAPDAVDALFDGPPPAKVSGDAIMKRYTGPGFPKIPGLRHVVHPFHPHLYQGDPLRELTLARRRKGGRNNTGQVVNKGVGGGHKQRLRIVDFYRLETGVHDVVRVEYDPGRSGHIALLHRRGASKKGPRVSAAEGAVLAETVSDAQGGSTAARIKRNEVKGGWSYILAPDGLRAGDTVQSFRSGVPEGMVEGWVDPGKAAKNADADGEGGIHSTAARSLGLLRTLTVKPGNVLPLSLIPAGTLIHNISMSPDGRMQLCRAAGTFGQVVAHHGTSGQAVGGADVLALGGTLDADGNRSKRQGSVLVKLQSGEVRRLEPDCCATVGVVSNKEHQQRQIGKAGRSRWLGKRPKVRGVAMNTCDHPHGGGRGKSKGNKHPRSQTGLLQGKRTRRPKDKNGNKMVVTQRPRGRASR